MQRVRVRLERIKRGIFTAPAEGLELPDTLMYMMMIQLTLTRNLHAPH